MPGAEPRRIEISPPPTYKHLLLLVGTSGGRTLGPDLRVCHPDPQFHVHQGMNERGTDGPGFGRGVREQRLGSEQLCAGEAAARQETFIMQICFQPAVSQQGLGEG